MQVKLDKQAEEFITRKVQEGEFRDAGEAISEAVHRMAEEEAKMRELRAALQIGIDQLDRGEKVRLTPDIAAEIFAEAKRRHESGQARKRDVLP